MNVHEKINYRSYYKAFYKRLLFPYINNQAILFSCAKFEYVSGEKWYPLKMYSNKKKQFKYKF